MTGLELLRAVVRDLGTFPDRMVFTGGLVLPLYLERRPTFRIRPTVDADAVVACASHREWIGLQGDLGRIGVVPLAGDPDAPICRMRTGGGYLLDLMPSEPYVLGFGNRWFRQGFNQAVTADIGEGLTIRVFPAPLYFAAKAEAFRGRGSQDPWSSHDLEDLLTLLACRPSLVGEVARVDEILGAYLAEVARQILDLERVDELIHGNIGEREDEIMAALAVMAKRQIG